MELPDELVGIEEELDIDEEPEPDLPGEASTERAESEEDDVDRERFLSVAVGPEEFALHVNAVRRLVDVDHWTRVPRTSAAIEGITDLRGEITAVIDPRELFEVPEPDSMPGTQELVVFATGSEGGPAGVVVDEVLGVEAVPVSHVVLEAEDVADDSEREVVDGLLESQLVAGLLRRRASDGGDPVQTAASDEAEPAGDAAETEVGGSIRHEYVPVIDVDAVLERASEAAV